MVKLSIIIPVYNVEKYIEKTLRSVLSQDVDRASYEVIVVNDGSPDKSLSIIQKIIEEGYDIKLINQKNQGLSIARNNGMRVAQGEYIWFVDSDDWIRENSLASLYGYMDGQIDEIVLGCEEVTDDGNLIGIYHNLYKTIQPEKLSGKTCWEKQVAQITAAQLTIYRKDFLKVNNLSFIPKIFHEDFEFCPRASYLSQTTIHTNEVYYYWRQNPAGITRTSNPQKSYDYIRVAQSLSEFMYGYVCEKSIQVRFNYYISIAINNSLNNIYLQCDEIIKEYEKFLTIHQSVLKALWKSQSLKYQIEYLAMKVFSSKKVAVYRFLYKLPLFVHRLRNSIRSQSIEGRR